MDTSDHQAYQAKKEGNKKNKVINIKNGYGQCIKRGTVDIVMFMYIEQEHII